MSVTKQIRRILLLDGLGSFALAGSVWVILLVGRGFSLVEIGMAEGFFHVVSFLFEIPSGILADVLGRKRAMLASQIMFAVSATLMVCSSGLVGVCIAMGANALAYNFASGAREALAYDTLLTEHREGEYLKFSSMSTVLWRMGRTTGMLCAGLAVFLGYQIAYGFDVVRALICCGVALTLWEPMVTGGQKGRETIPVPLRLRTCLEESGAFLARNPKAAFIMLTNALVGAVATLLGFFLQDGLLRAGVTPLVLGPLLLCIGLGGVVGARMSIPLSKLRYRSALPLCALGVVVGLALAFSGSVVWMALGGFLAMLCDDALQVYSDNLLNQSIPSDQRATLLSVSSMAFSLVMIVLSPLAGAVFSVGF